MPGKKEEFELTDQTSMSEEKKKKRRKWRIKQNGRWFKIDKKCIKESAMLRSFHGTTYFETESLNIRRTSILIKALDFCNKRGDIKTTYARDQNLLRDKLKEFDSDFLRRIKNNYDDDTIIDLIDAANKLDIESLFNLLFEDVVDKIAHKTPEDISEVFKIRYEKDDDGDHFINMMNLVMDGSHWPLREVM